MKSFIAFPLIIYALLPKAGLAQTDVTKECNAKIQEQFSESDVSHKVIVTSLGSDTRADLIGRFYERSIMEFLQQKIDIESGFSRVKFYPCKVNSQEEAVRIGLLTKADVVVWGDVKWKPWDHPSYPAQRSNGQIAAAQQSSSGRTVSEITIQNYFSGSVETINQGTIINTDRRYIAHILPQVTITMWKNLSLESDNAVYYDSTRDINELTIVDLLSEEQRGVFMLSLAFWFHQRGMHETATQFLNSYYRFFHGDGGKILGRSPDKMVLYENMFEIYRNTNSSERALDTLYRMASISLATFKKCPGNYFDLVNSLKIEKAQSSKKIKILEDLIPIIHNLADESCEMLAYENIGRISMGINKPVDALAAFRHAFDLSEKKGDVLAQAELLEQIGQSYIHLGNIAAAMKTYSDVLLLWRKQNNALREADILHELALISEKKRGHDAIGFFLQEISLRSKYESHYKEALARQSLARLYEKLESFDLAIKEYVAAGENYENNQPPDRDESLECYNYARKLARQKGLVELELQLSSKISKFPKAM